MNTAVTTAQEAKKESSGRLAALKGTQAALSGAQAAGAGRAAGATGDGGGLAGVAVSLGTQTSASEQHTQSNTVSGSTLSAGNNLSITATGKEGGGDIAVAGSRLKAGGDTTLDARRDLLLSGTASTQETRGRNQSSGGSIGASLGPGGLSLFANGNSSKGHENGNGTAWTETTIDSGGSVALHSGRDTTLTGRAGQR